MPENDVNSPEPTSFRFEWGAVKLEVQGGDGVVQTGFDLLENEILPRIDDSGASARTVLDTSSEDGEDGSDQGATSRDRSVTPKEFMADKDPGTTYEKATALAFYAKFYQDQEVITADELDKLITQSQLGDFKASDALYNAERSAGYMENLGRGKFKLTQTGIRYVQQDLGAD